MTYRDKVVAAEASGRWYCRTCDATFTGEKAGHFASRYHKTLLTYKTERHLSIDPLDLVDDPDATPEGPHIKQEAFDRRDALERESLNTAIWEVEESDARAAKALPPEIEARTEAHRRPSGLSMMVEAVGHVLDSESMGYVEAHRIATAVLERLNSGGYILVKKGGAGAPIGGSGFTVDPGIRAALEEGISSGVFTPASSTRRAASIADGVDGECDHDFPERDGRCTGCGEDVPTNPGYNFR